MPSYVFHGETNANAGLLKGFEQSIRQVLKPFRLLFILVHILFISTWWKSLWIKLTLTYVCRKCVKTYSQQDYNGDSFCSVCGSFLVKQYTITARSPIEQFKKLVKTKPEPLAAAEVKENANLKRVAEALRQRSQTTKEYEVLHEPETQKATERKASEGWLFESEYDQALRLKLELTRKFEGKGLEEAIPGKVVSNEHGECYCVSENHDMQFRNVGFEESRRVLLSDLTLLSGIGPAREKTLKQQGYRTVEVLETHHKWRKQAKEYLELVDSKNVFALQEHLRSCLPKSHPLGHYLAGFCRNEDFAIIDIETLGLFGRPIILVGVANVANSGVCTRQFLVRDVSEEAGALYAFMSGLKSGSVLVSFNGRCFDVPFIRERLAYYGLNSQAQLDSPHFDVLHFTRRALRGKLNNYCLETVEKYLDIQRSIDIPGALVPEFYDSYQRTGNVGPLVAIVEHNKQDLVTLTQLFCSLYKEWKL